MSERDERTTEEIIDCGRFMRWEVPLGEFTVYEGRWMPLADVPPRWRRLPDFTRLPLVETVRRRVVAQVDVVPGRRTIVSLGWAGTGPGAVARLEAITQHLDPDGRAIELKMPDDLGELGEPFCIAAEELKHALLALCTAFSVDAEHRASDHCVQ